MTEKANTDTNKEFIDSLVKVLVFTFFIAATICVFYYYHFNGGITDDHSKWAEFGDFVGGTIGTLISFMAFFALLLTISLQSKALKTSQQELSLTRNELRKTSEAASDQAHHFSTEAKIQDLLESIRLVEETIKLKGKYTLAVGDLRIEKPKTVRLSCFLDKDMASVSYLYGVDQDIVRDLDLRQEEIGELFELLFDQLMQLKHIPEAVNRYKVLMHKHLEVFFLLSQVSALTFDWKKELDKESKEWLKTYERNFRAYQIEYKRQLNKQRGVN